MIRKQEVLICHGSGAKTQGLKSLSENSCSEKASDTNCYDKTLPGKPDLVFPQYKTAIFIHGCFWHGHEGCRYFVIPKSRRKWWVEKINRNKQLDAYQTIENLGREL